MLRKSLKGMEYSEELKKFALNLNFYSPKAYNYVRGRLGLCLPHSKTISRWYQSVDGSPGFTKESFTTLRNLVDISKTKNEQIITNLVFDEISIRSRREWDEQKKRAWGYVEVGPDSESNKTLAEQILVFMLVSVNQQWKIPIGYFPITSLTGDQRKNIIKLCLKNVVDTGVEVVGITCDGLPANLTAAKLLGCCLDSSKICSTFSLANVGSFLFNLDGCHMMKLVRNTIAEKGPLIDGTGGIIDWAYLKKLYEIQSEQELHFGNKLSINHIMFAKQKMKVKLAVQTLSNSVADSLLYLKRKGHADFADSDATINFIRKFNDIFDILNSRSVNAYGFKKAICSSNIEAFKRTSNEAIAYIKSLKFKDNLQPVLDSRRHTGFLGIILCLNNIETIYSKFIQPKKLEYVPMYKLSQDHLELFFSSVRCRLGYNNNPTVKQFAAAYKRLLLHVQINKTTGNCFPQLDISILQINVVKSTVKLINEHLSQRQIFFCDQDENTSESNDEINRQPEMNFIAQSSPIHCENNSENSYLEDDTNEPDIIQPSLELSEYQKDIIEYVAGFVVRYLYARIKCESCLDVLQSSNDKYFLIDLKDRNNKLRKPSFDVIKICEFLEKQIRMIIKSNIAISATIYNKIILKVQEKFCNATVFLEAECHRNLLIRCIGEKYLNVRFHYIAKLENKKISLRSFYTRIINFQGM